MLNEQEAKRALEKYANTVRRICFVHLKNHHDTEDIFQEVFLKYLTRKEAFENGDHEKAWIIRVTINACKDLLKSFFRRNQTSLDELTWEPQHIDNEHRYVLEAVTKLPAHYRDVVFLFYYEGYSAVEIAQILSRKENTIYTWLARAREQLRLTLGGEYFE